MSNRGLRNFVRQRREARGWSQQQLAAQAGIARTSVSAIESDRLVPSAAAALALAAALDCRVEDLFRLTSDATSGPDWAWAPTRLPARYWVADVQGQTRCYPVEPTYVGTLPHDGMYDGGTFRPHSESPPDTLVLATCDPAVGLLAHEVARASGVRVLPIVRSSRAALKLLADGLVHVAGLHLGKASDDANAAIVASELGPAYRLVHLAEWEEGIVTAGDRPFRSIRAVTQARLRWIGREPGSGARQCLDEVLGSRTAPRQLARDHRGVAEAVRTGWADAGVCLRLVGEEASLQFLPVRREAYDVCYHESLGEDPRLRVLLAAIRSTRYRGLLDDLPGVRAAQADHA